MATAFQYKPRFRDMRVRPPKDGEDQAEADVLTLKPGEKRCQWPDCSRAATARAPKSREKLSEFYDFCQAHAGEYNKSWNFYAGMSEGEVRAAQENEAMTGGRPTWEMKAGKMSREAAAWSAPPWPTSIWRPEPTRRPSRRAITCCSNASTPTPTAATAPPRKSSSVSSRLGRR